MSAVNAHMVSEVGVRAIKQDKETKSKQVWKEQIKVSLFADDITVYAENIKEPTKN